MATIMSDISVVFGNALEWVGEVADVVTAEPLLMVWFIIPLVGIGVGLFKRLVSLH